MSEIRVKKRDGSLEILDIAKINRVTDWASAGLAGVNKNDVEINAKVNWHDGITSTEIHDSLIESAHNLISVEFPNYQFVASRLLSFKLRKQVWGGKTPPRLFDHIKKHIDLGIYDNILLEKYTESEINKANEFVDHDRDYEITYGGLRQLCDKYLVQDRTTKVIYETPQFAYICIALAVFANYTTNRMYYVKEAYNAFSKMKINLPTPTLAGVRTKLRSYSSCCLIDIGDDKHEIFAGITATGLATMARYGIGINLGKMRSIGSKIGNGEVIHPGVIPFLKTIESTVRACYQNGIRGGSASINFPVWHYEIEDIIQLKNNSGTDDNRVRYLDYTISFSKLFYERYLKKQHITLFSPHEVPDLYQAFGHPEFDELYVKYENDRKIRKKKIAARDLFSLLVKERVETGRIYILNVDHINNHGAWAVDVKMSNLCAEITVPTSPFKSLDDPNGEIGICTLAALNVLEVKDHEYEKICDITVRMLDELLDLQEYFCEPARNFAINRRSLGIGITNFAAYLAKQGLTYNSPEAPNAMDEIMERTQYYLLKASNNLAKEKGTCAKFNETKYSQGILPIDTYQKKIDAFITRKTSLDWEQLREEIRLHGLRHSTLTAQMPVQSSGVVGNTTIGVEPVRSLKTYHNSKSGSVLQILPNVKQLKNKYQLAFSEPLNEGYLKIMAAQQKWLDMAGSYNNYYAYSHYVKNMLPDDEVIRHLLLAYSYGIVSLYYCNTDDGNKHFEEPSTGCDSGSCSI